SKSHRIAKTGQFPLSYPLSRASIDRGGGPPLYWIFAPEEDFRACLVSVPWADYSTRHSFGLPSGICELQLTFIGSLPRICAARRNYEQHQGNTTPPGHGDHARRRPFFRV